MPAIPDRDAAVFRLSPRRQAAYALGALLALGMAVWRTAAFHDRVVADPLAPITPQSTLVEAPKPSEAAMPLLDPGIASLEVIVRSNDTLDRIFRQSRLSVTDLANLRAISGVRQALDRLMPGELLRLTHRDGALMTLERNLSLTQKLQIQRDESGFHADIVARPLETAMTVAHGVVRSSLFEAADDAGLQDATVLKLARLFGWDIDFALDLRAGDQFDVYYERHSQNGSFLQDGEIYAARFVNQGRVYLTVRYTAPDGSTGYYTADGHSIEKAFLRAPLEFRRVSSRFSTGRYHPILNRIRAHKGVDYAAAIGTPVQAAGAGRIRFRGAKGGYGNVVEIDHGAGIVTVYGHLSRFATGQAVGAQVQQGALVGYVGMTGLATGPHLHYEYRLNGQYLDPQRVKLPDSRPIDAALMPDFKRQTANLMVAVQPASQPAPASVRAAAPAGSTAPL